MEYVTTLEELEEKITDNRLQAVFLTAKNCSVCTEFDKYKKIVNQKGSHRSRRLPF